MAKRGQAIIRCSRLSHGHNSRAPSPAKGRASVPHGPRGRDAEELVLDLVPDSNPELRAKFDHNLAADSYVRINGTPSNTQSFKIEGQDAYSGIYTNQSWTQPSVDAVQEISVLGQFETAGRVDFGSTLERSSTISSTLHT